MKVHGRSAVSACALALLSACGGGGGSPPSAPVVTSTFTTWRTDLANKTVRVDGEGQQVSYTWNNRITSVSPTVDTSASGVFVFDASSTLTQLFLASGGTTTAFTTGQVGTLAADPDFVVAENLSSRAIVSNPKSLAWDYQSFGVWETGLDSNEGNYGAVSLGAPTAGTAIPGSGTATFTGKLAGSYVNASGVGHSVLADLTVLADWNTTSLSLSTSNTRTSTNGTTFVPSDGLNLSGNLQYAAGTNGFTGTLTTGTTPSGTVLSGDSAGKFYGPNAEELGGTFFLRGSGVETYSGAYGAKVTTP